MANMCAKVTSTYMEFILAFGPKLEFSFSFKFFSTTHSYILAHIVLKINICFPLGKKFARLTHHYYNIFMGNPLTSSKDLSISLLKLLECRMQWYIDFVTKHNKNTTLSYSNSLYLDSSEIVVKLKFFSCYLYSSYYILFDRFSNKVLCKLHVKFC